MSRDIITRTWEEVVRITVALVTWPLMPAILLWKRSYHPFIVRCLRNTVGLGLMGDATIVAAVLDIRRDVGDAVFLILLAWACWVGSWIFFRFAEEAWRIERGYLTGSMISDVF